MKNIENTADENPGKYNAMFERKKSKQRAMF